MTDEHDDTRAPAVKRARRSKKSQRTPAPQASGEAEPSAGEEAA